MSKTLFSWKGLIIPNHVWIVTILTIYKTHSTPCHHSTIDHFGFWSCISGFYIFNGLNIFGSLHIRSPFASTKLYKFHVDNIPRKSPISIKHSKMELDKIAKDILDLINFNLNQTFCNWVSLWHKWYVWLYIYGTDISKFYPLLNYFPKSLHIHHNL